MTPRTDDAAREAIAVALGRARDRDKRVMVVFGADWCADAAAFQESLDHPLIAPLVDLGLEVVHLDVGARDRHLDIARGWGIDYADGIPTVAVLDAEGELITATRDGELRTARDQTPIQIATLIHRWLPAGVGTAG